MDDATPDDFVNAIDSSSSNHTVPTESIGGQMVLSRRQRSYRLCVASAILIAPTYPQMLTDWQTRDFPPPNAGLLVFTTVGGNPACASYNGRDCLWGQNKSQIDFSRVLPLVCGANHRAIYGVTGYEDPKHWCNLARGQRID